MLFNNRIEMLTQNEVKIMWGIWHSIFIYSNNKSECNFGPVERLNLVFVFRENRQTNKKRNVVPSAVSSTQCFFIYLFVICVL